MTRAMNPHLPMTTGGLSRRRFLGGAGTLVALPFLESLLPRRAQAAPLPKRLLFFYVPCGIHMANWTPQQAGDDWPLTPILSPLAAVLVLGVTLSISYGTNYYSFGVLAARTAALRGAEAREFNQVVQALVELVELASRIMDRVAASERSKIVPAVLKLFK